MGKTAARFPAVPGKPVRTSIDMQMQMAASAAVSSAATKKPVNMVITQPSTGKVLAVVERPGGFDRALEGIFPPGSTFKVVTASGLAGKGMTPSSTVQCPSTADLGGRVFHNDANEHLGTTNLQTAFAVSCNTTFAMLASERLGGPALAAMARTFGFNAQANLGIPATLGHFSTPHQPVNLAADAFGQGTDLVNPLSQATVAAAIEDGTWRPPLLVTDPMPKQTATPHKLSAAILNTLRPMMRAVVTSGTAAAVGFGPGVYGKTGTAQYGNGTPLARLVHRLPRRPGLRGPGRGRRLRRQQRRAGGQGVPVQGGWLTVPGSAERDRDTLKTQRVEHPGQHADGVFCAGRAAHYAAGRVLDLLLGQDVDLLLAVRVAGEEVADPVQQPLLLGDHIGLPHVEHGRLELGGRQPDGDRPCGPPTRWPCP